MVLYDGWRGCLCGRFPGLFGGFGCGVLMVVVTLLVGGLIVLRFRAVLLLIVLLIARSAGGCVVFAW